MLDTSKITTEQYVLGAIAGFLLLFAIGTCGGGGAKDPQTLAHKLVQAIAQDDKAAAEKLLLNRSQHRTIVMKSTLKESEKQQLLAKLPEGESLYRLSWDLSWKAMYGDMLRDGFDRQHIKVVSVDAKDETREGVPGAKVNVDVESSGKHGRIRLTAIKANRWVLEPEVSFTSNTDMQPHSVGPSL